MESAIKIVLIATLMGLSGTQNIRPARQQYFDSPPTGFDAQYPNFERQRALIRSQPFRPSQPLLEPQSQPQFQPQQPLEQPSIYQQPYKGPEYYQQPQNDQQLLNYPSQLTSEYNPSENRFFTSPERSSINNNNIFQEQIQPQQLPQQQQQPRSFFAQQPLQNPNLFTPAGPQDAYVNPASIGQVENYQKALEEEQEEARGLTRNGQQVLQGAQQAGQDYGSLQRAYAANNQGRQTATSYVNVQYGPNQGYSFDVAY